MRLLPVVNFLLPPFGKLHNSLARLANATLEILRGEEGGSVSLIRPIE